MQTVRLSWVKSKTFIRNENGGLTTGFNLSLVVLVTVLVAVAIAVPLVVLWNEPKWTQVENSTEIVTSAIFVTDEVITKREPLSFGPTLETTVNTAVTITIEDLTEPSTDLPIEPQTDEPQTSVPSNLPTNPPTVPPTTTTTEAPTACDFSPCNNNGVCSDNNSPTVRLKYHPRFGLFSGFRIISIIKRSVQTSFASALFLTKASLVTPKYLAIRSHASTAAGVAI